MAKFMIILGLAILLIGGWVWQLNEEGRLKPPSEGVPTLSWLCLFAGGVLILWPILCGNQ